MPKSTTAKPESIVVRKARKWLYDDPEEMPTCAEMCAYERALENSPTSPEDVRSVKRLFAEARGGR